MKRFALAILTVLVVSTLAAYGGPKPQEPAPETMKFVVPEGWLELGRYPVITRKHVMTDAELQELGLQRAKLERPTLFYNHYRSLGKDRKGGWRHEVLPTGTGVAVDEKGRAWYRLDCSNRIYAPVEREAGYTSTPAKLPPQRSSTPTPPQAGKDSKQPTQKKSWDWPSPLWFLLIPASLLGWWGLRRLKQSSEDSEDQGDAGDLSGRIGAVEDELGGVRDTVAGVERRLMTELTGLEDRVVTRLEPTVRDTVAGVERRLMTELTGLEDRVVTRLEPTVREAVDNGGRLRARIALTEQIVAASSRNDMALVNALNLTLTALE